MNKSAPFHPAGATRLPAAAPTLRTTCAVLAALAMLANAQAQQVIMAVPQQPLVAPVMRPATPEVVPAATDFQAFPNGPSIAVGDFQLRPHLFTSLVHADGLPVQSGQRVTSDIFTFSPGLLADVGSHWSFDYTATAHNYSAGELRDTVDQDVRLVGANKSPDWGLQLTEGYSISSPILVETAQQTKQKIWVNSLSVNHEFGNLLHYLSTYGMTYSNSQDLATTRDWSTEQNLNARVSSRVDVGVGLGFGYSDIIAHPNSRYEKYLANLDWRPLETITLALQGGWQDWHSLATAGIDERNPVLQATLGLVPFPQTRLTISDSRTTANSLTGDSVTDNKAWNASLNQRLFGVLFVDLGYAHIDADYRSTTGNLLGNRSDQVSSFNAGLSVQVFKYWRLGASYLHSKNESSDVNYRYTSTQYGIELRGSF